MEGSARIGRKAKVVVENDTPAVPAPVYASRQHRRACERKAAAKAREPEQRLRRARHTRTVNRAVAALEGDDTISSAKRKRLGPGVHGRNTIDGGSIHDMDGRKFDCWFHFTKGVRVRQVAR